MPTTTNKIDTMSNLNNFIFFLTLKITEENLDEITDLFKEIKSNPELLGRCIKPIILIYSIINNDSISDDIKYHKFKEYINILDTIVAQYHMTHDVG